MPVCLLTCFISVFRCASGVLTVRRDCAFTKTRTAQLEIRVRGVSRRRLKLRDARSISARPPTVTTVKRWKNVSGHASLYDQVS